MLNRQVIRRHIKNTIDQGGLSRYMMLDILSAINAGQSETKKTEMKTILVEVLFTYYPREAPVFIGMVY